jgi:hypothetical protein
VKKKPQKLEEPAAPYTADKPRAKAPATNADQPVRYVDNETARKLTKQIFDKHHELFRKLAQ